MANAYADRTPRLVPKQASNYPYHLGGWFNSTPADDLLEGWWTEWSAPHNRIIFVRRGRGGHYEEFWVQCRILATCEAMPDSSDLYELSYPMVDLRWHGEADRLRDLQTQVMANKQLAAWAYYEAGRDLELVRTQPGYTPRWLYPLGDKRPAWMKMRALELQPIPSST